MKSYTQSISQTNTLDKMSLQEVLTVTVISKIALKYLLFSNVLDTFMAQVSIVSFFFSSQQWSAVYTQ